MLSLLSVDAVTCSVLGRSATAFEMFTFSWAKADSEVFEALISRWMSPSVLASVLVRSP